VDSRSGARQLPDPEVRCGLFKKAAPLKRCGFFLPARRLADSRHGLNQPPARHCDEIHGAT
jgi:hypothetical protein